MKEKIKPDDKARQFYGGFEYCLNGVQTHLSSKLKDEYIINASVLNVLIRDLSDKITLAGALNNNRRDFWGIINGSCARLREVYGHTLPKNLNRLKDEIRIYKLSIESFRMAVQNTGRKPYEVVTDNQGGAKTNKIKDFMRAISQ